MSRSKTVSVATFAAVIATLACFGDFHLRASNLQIGPNPAVPGDVVVASFIVAVTPVQRHTIVFWIDNTEHTRVTSNEAPPIPYVLTLGDAADLISEYGAGMHAAYVEVRAEEEDETARTQAVGFELRATAP